MSESITFDKYTMSKSKMLIILALRHMRLTSAITAMAAFAMMLLGIICDLRFIIAALLVILIIYPMMVSWLYIRHCFTRDIAMNIVEHTTTLHKDRLEVEWRPSLLSSEQKEIENDTEEQANNSNIVLEKRKDIIPFSRITHTSIGLSALTIWLKDSGEGAGFVYIPYDTIPEGKSDEVVETLQKRKN